MLDKLLPWASGLVFSLVLGHFVTKCVIAWIRRQVGCHDEVYNSYLEKYESRLPEPEFNPKPVPPSIQGMVERFFFTVMFGLDVSGAPTAMMAWLGVKMLTNLNRGDRQNHEIVRSRALTGLLGAMVSLFFAFAGGLLCRQDIHFPTIY